MTQDTWLQEAVLEFFRSPLYLNPLMTFVDENCIIFSTEDENPFEYSKVHQEFKDVVESLITTFLEDMGVTAEEFAKTLEEQEQMMNKTVLHSLLAVDDFLQFKNLMIQRNLYLQNQVAKHLEAIAAEEAEKKRKEEEERESAAMEKARKEAEALGEGDDEELIAAIRASMATFEGETSAEAQEEKERRKKMVEEFMGDATDEEKAMAAALADSLRVKTAIELEQAMVERAIAMSLSGAPPSVPPTPGAGPSAAPDSPLPSAPPANAPRPVPHDPDTTDKVTEPPTPVREPQEPAPKPELGAVRLPGSKPAPAGAIPVARPPAPATGSDAPASAAAPAESAGEGPAAPSALPAVGMTPPKVAPNTAGRGAGFYRGAGFNSKQGTGELSALDPVKLQVHQDKVKAKMEAMKSRAAAVDDAEKSKQDEFFRRQRERLLEAQRLQRMEEMDAYVKRSQAAAQGTDEAEARRGKFFADMAARMRQDLQS